MTGGVHLEGHVVLVTGAAQGLGAAQARLFVEREARVLLADLQEPAVRERAESLGESARFVRLDVTVERDWLDAVELAGREFGALHGLVNNAGISPTPLPIEHTSLADFERVVRVNQVGTFLGLRACIPALRASGGGSIVTIASTAGVEAATGIGPYVSSKYAVRGLTRVAALEVARENIRVNCILPGPMDTPMNDAGGWYEGVDLRPGMAEGNPTGRIGSPEEVAEVAAFLLSEASSFCNGADFAVDGGNLAGLFMPTFDASADG